MRLFLLPISTRRTLIYCQRLNAATPENQSWLDKGTTKAADLWAGWEKKESGWQKKVVEYGNYALKRIPFEEWGLKSIPPLSSRRIAEETTGPKVEVSFPESLMARDKVIDVLRLMGTERQGLHKQRLIWSFVGMPLVAPFAIVPVVPNLPFFYLVFRAWSHWRALSGSKHIEFLLQKNLVNPQPSTILDELYSTGKLPFKPESTSKTQQTNQPGAENMILHISDGKRIADALKIPELNIELDRAVWQVERAIAAEKALLEEKTKSDSKDSKDSDKQI